MEPILKPILVVVPSCREKQKSFKNMPPDERRAILSAILGLILLKF
jgi:hypothetical protein